MEPIQIGILGAAPIAPQALIAPASHVAEVAVYGTATRDVARAQAFAQKHQNEGHIIWTSHRYRLFSTGWAICETVKDDLEKMDGNSGRHQSSNNSPRIVEHPRTEPIHYSFFPFSPLDYIPYGMVCFL